jgi:conjugal transfer pilus assembly protein TraB
MSDTGKPPSLREFLLGSKKGRMILLAGLLGGLLLLAPVVAGRKREADARTSSPQEGPALGKPHGGSDLPPSPNGFGETLTLGQKYDALISRFGGDLTSTRSELDLAKKELETLRGALKAEKTSQEKERKDLSDYLKQLKEGLARETAQPVGRDAQVPPSAGLDRSGPAAPGALRSIELAPPVPKDRKDKRAVRVPTAAGGMATLMNGVFAPVTGEPSPVRLRFDSAILGPNKARIPLRDSFLIGKATGDPNSCRVSIQIEKFSTVKEKGEVLESKALGYVVAEDGLEGVPGSYEWRAMEYVPLALGTGAAQGLSGALAQSQTTQTLNPLGGATSVLTGDSMKMAGYQAMGGASGKLGDIVAERMKEIRPAVSTPANRKVTVVFLDGMTLEGLEPEEIDHGFEKDPFRGLDAHR